MKVIQGQPKLLEIVQALRPPARLMAQLDRRQSSPMSVPMMTMTTRSSTSVKPCL